MVDAKRRLKRDDKVVKTYSLEKVTKDFQLEVLSIRDQVQGRIVLIGYCCHTFDIPLLKKEMLRCGLTCEIFCEKNVVYADLYQLLCDNKATLLPGHDGDLKMTTVYNVLCGTQNVHMHDAVEDAEKLRAIYAKIAAFIPKSVFEKYVFEFSEVTKVPRPAMSQQRRRDSVKRCEIEVPDGPAKKKHRANDY